MLIRYLVLKLWRETLPRVWLGVDLLGTVRLLRVRLELIRNSKWRRIIITRAKLNSKNLFSNGISAM